MADFDIANLADQEIDQGGEYEAPSEFFRPPEPTERGERETIQAVEAPADGKFYPVTDFDTRQVIPGFMVNLQFEIKGGKQDGKRFFAMIDTRKKLQRNSSDVKDYLLGMGFAGVLRSVDDFKTAVQTTLAPVDARLTWTGDKCQTCDKKTVKRISEFPLKDDGTRNHVTKCPDCGEDVGARVKIAMFYVDGQ